MSQNLKLAWVWECKIEYRKIIESEFFLEQMWVMNSMNVGNRGDFGVAAVEVVSWRSLISRDELRCKIH